MLESFITVLHRLWCTTKWFNYNKEQYFQEILDNKKRIERNISFNPVVLKISSKLSDKHKCSIFVKNSRPNREILETL